MYRLRFYDTVKKQYGILYLTDGSNPKELDQSQLFKLNGRFKIKHCARYKNIAHMLI